MPCEPARRRAIVTNRQGQGAVVLGGPTTNHKGSGQQLIRVRRGQAFSHLPLKAGLTQLAC